MTNTTDNGIMQAEVKNIDLLETKEIKELIDDIKNLNSLKVNFDRNKL